MVKERDLENRIKALETALKKVGIRYDGDGVNEYNAAAVTKESIMRQNHQFFYGTRGLKGCRSALEEMKIKGYRPLNAAEIMKARVEVLRGEDEALKSSWLSRHLISADGFAYGIDSAKFVQNLFGLESKYWRTAPEKGMIFIPREDYNSLIGVEFTEKLLKETCSFSSTRGTRSQLTEGKKFSKREAMANPVLRAVALNEEIIDDYIHEAFKAVSSNNGSEMAVPVCMKSFSERDTFITPCSLSSMDNYLGVSSYLGSVGITMVGVKE